MNTNASKPEQRLRPHLSSRLFPTDMISRFKMLAENIVKSWVRRQPRPILCEELKLIYYPIPKVATSTVRRYLIENGFPGSLKGEALTHNHIQHFTFPRITLKEAFALQGKGYRSFAVVRNPYARITSCYLDKIAGAVSAGNSGEVSAGFRRYNDLSHRKLFYETMNFKEFVNIIRRIPDFAADAHFRSQRTFLPLKRGIIDLDQLIQIERFDEQFPAFLAGIDCPKWQSARENQTKRKGSLLSEFPETLPLIRRRYANCFHLLGYSSNEIPDA
jgi:hypothetical protein